MNTGKQDLTKQEEFKRATAGTLRAVAHASAEVQVAFQPGPGGVSGKRVRLPLPTRALPPTEMAKLRGAGYSKPLGLAGDGPNSGLLVTRSGSRAISCIVR